MADKSNPFRHELRRGLAEHSIDFVSAFPAGASIDLYTRDQRWVAVMLYQSRPSSQGHWWNIPHHFEPLRRLELKYPGYLVLGVYQDDADTASIVTGAQLNDIFLAKLESADQVGNVKVKPEDFYRAQRLQGAGPIAAYISGLVERLPPASTVTADDLIPTPTRRQRQRIARCNHCDVVLDLPPQSAAHEEFTLEMQHLQSHHPGVALEGSLPLIQVFPHFTWEGGRPKPRRLTQLEQALR